MTSTTSRVYSDPIVLLRLLATLLVALASILNVGCVAGVSSQPQGSTPSGNTLLTVLSTSTANDQLFQFSAVINTLTLTSQSGKTVGLLTTPLYSEFMHLNGVLEPLVTVSVPQDIYTSATASLGPAGFTCASLGSNDVFATGFFGDTDSTPAADVTVSLPTPIKVTGSSMVISLDLLVPQSASYASCDTTGNRPFSLTPTFSLTPVIASAQPTNSGNGKLNGLEGVIASTDSMGNSFVVNSADGSNYGGLDPSDSIDPANGPNWRIEYNGSTVFQGIASSSKLAEGLPVDMDAVIQADGSLLATRIAVYDTDAADTSLWVVPALYEENSSGPRIFTGEKEQVGPVLGGDGATVDLLSSVFNISDPLTNLATLPFQPSFTAANMVAGQNIELTFHAANYGNSEDGPPATTATLLPQTLNGTVGAIGSEGGFTTYTITLAPYDLFPELAVQSGQTTLLNDPDTVVVYADNNTQMLNASPISVGSVVRFYGLVFNDNGTLRMDCAQINDGVPE